MGKVNFIFIDIEPNQNQSLQDALKTLKYYRENLNNLKTLYEQVLGKEKFPFNIKNPQNRLREERLSRHDQLGVRGI